jgi:hypothetical protein
MEENSIDSLINNERPKALKVLCILSFVNLGFSFLGVILQFHSGPASKKDMLFQRAEMSKNIEQLENMNADFAVDAIHKLTAMAESLNDSFYAVTVLTLISSAVGLFGVLKMWKGAKIGFHFYIIYSLITVGHVYLFVSPSSIPSFIVIWNLLIAGLFVFLYSRNLSWMK